MDFLVSEQSLTTRLGNQPVLASDSVKFTSLTFYFDSSWDGLTKTAYFHQPDLDSPISSILDSSGTCYLPNSLTAGKAWVGLSGHSSDGEKIGTTNKIMLVIHQSAYDDDAQAEVDPSPSLYAELLAQFEEYVGEAEGYAESAEASKNAINNMTVSSVTGEAGSSVSVDKTESSGTFNLEFTIPRGDTGPIGVKGDTGSPFYIAKTYSSVLEMNADYDGTDVEVNEFVLISTSSVEDEDNAKVYVKTDTSYQFVTDLSGAQGIQGQTGNGIASITLTSTVGLVKTYTVLFTDSTTTTFSVNDGEKGDTGDAFTTEMTYSSVSAMNAGYATDGVSIGGYVIISPASTSDPDYGKVYQKGSTEYEYVITMTGVKGDDGDDGVTFTPSVSSAGVISWTNDGGLSNPDAVNIKGTNGADGYTPVKGTDYFTDAEVAEIENTVYNSLSDGILGDIEGVLVEINDGGTSE